MNVIGERGDDTYLVDIGKGQGVVVVGTEVFPPHTIQSILARGYWEEFTGSAFERKRVLRLASEAKQLKRLG